MRDPHLLQLFRSGRVLVRASVHGQITSACVVQAELTMHNTEVLSALLNDGVSAETGARILSASTVKLMWENQIPNQYVPFPFSSTISTPNTNHIPSPDQTSPATRHPRQTRISKTQRPKSTRRKATRRRAGA